MHSWLFISIIMTRTNSIIWKLVKIASCIIFCVYNLMLNNSFPELKVLANKRSQIQSYNLLKKQLKLLMKFLRTRSDELNHSTQSMWQRTSRGKVQHMRMRYYSERQTEVLQWEADWGTTVRGRLRYCSERQTEVLQWEADWGTALRGRLRYYSERQTASSLIASRIVNMLFICTKKVTSCTCL